MGCDYSTTLTFIVSTTHYEIHNLEYICLPCWNLNLKDAHIILVVKMYPVKFGVASFITLFKPRVNSKVSILHTRQLILTSELWLMKAGINAHSNKESNDVLPYKPKALHESWQIDLDSRVAFPWLTLFRLICHIYVLLSWHKHDDKDEA